jgi:hypothetical protein
MQRGILPARAQSSQEQPPSPSPWPEDNAMMQLQHSGCQQCWPGRAATRRSVCGVRPIQRLRSVNIILTQHLLGQQVDVRSQNPCSTQESPKTLLCPLFVQYLGRWRTSGPSSTEGSHRTTPISHYPHPHAVCPWCPLSIHFAAAHGKPDSKSDFMPIHLKQ